MQNQVRKLKERYAEHLERAGYTSYAEYMKSEFVHFYNLLGYNVAPNKRSKNRAYDFAQDKVRGLLGSEFSSLPGKPPLVGLRGTALEIEGVDDDDIGNQKVLSFILEAVIEANENTQNHGWISMSLWARREKIDTLQMVLRAISQKIGKLPKQLGIMIEVPSAAIYAEQYSRQLSGWLDEFKPFGVEKVFFSFGTNDLTQMTIYRVTRIALETK